MLFDAVGREETNMGKGSAAASSRAVKASIREAIVKLTDDKGLDLRRDAEPPAPVAQSAARSAVKSKPNRLLS